MSIQQERAVGNKASAVRLVTTTRVAQVARIIFVVLAAALAGCVIAQVFIAGLAVFVSPINWKQHTSFIHTFQFLPLLMLIFSFVGRLPGVLRWQSAALIFLIFAQYFTANIATPLPFAAAAHPVIALVIFWLATLLLSKAWRLTFRAQTAT